MRGSSYREERADVRLPRSIDDAKKLGLVLSKYREEHYPQVLASVSITYIILQTLAIPGSIFLSILSGYLFPFYTALFLVCTVSFKTEEGISKRILVRKILKSFRLVIPGGFAILKNGYFKGFKYYVVSCL